MLMDHWRAETQNYVSHSGRQTDRYCERRLAVERQTVTGHSDFGKKSITKY
jgi:hypothetical protein